jgi:hypothetical protein
MSHRDRADFNQRLNGDLLRVALNWLLQGGDWSSICWRSDCTWTPKRLVSVALLWAWSDETTLVERFRSARKIALFLAPGQDEVAASYQAFVKLLVRWTCPLVALLQTIFRQRMQVRLADCWRVGGFVMFGVDGTHAALPRTVSHEQAYSPTRGGRRRQRGAPKTRGGAKRAHKAQLWITTLWHVGSGLPWDWRIGPSDSSERAHWLEMLPNLPPEALIAADAGFVGYEYVRAVIDSGRSLLLRVGRHVRLLKKLGYARERQCTVYLWPDQQAKRGQPPLVLRLVEAHNGKHPIYLLTNVPPARLSDRQVIEFYARRWGIELFYRNLKQTFACRKLRSASAKPARMELEWALVGLWAMSLYALVQLRQQQLPARRLSCAKLLQAFRRTLRDYRHPAERGWTLCDRLQQALIDDYQRGSKANRDSPAGPHRKPPGAPYLFRANKAQIQLAKTLRKPANLRLTA